MTIKFSTAIALATLGAAALHNAAIGEQTTIEKAEVQARKVIREGKKAGRAIDEKVCDTIRGKTECVGKKIKNDLKHAKELSQDKTF